MKINKHVKALGIAGWAVALFGFIAPSLISSSSDAGVLLGTALLAVTIYGGAIYTINKLKEKLNNEGN